MNRPYWYMTRIDYCPVCGSEKRIRIRQYTEKPINPQDRVVVSDVYDWCDAL